MKNKNIFTNILHICAGKINGNKYMTMETLNIHLLPEQYR
jgi:hypothetical protein